MDMKQLMERLGDNIAQSEFSDKTIIGRAFTVFLPREEGATDIRPIAIKALNQLRREMLDWADHIESLITKE